MILLLQFVNILRLILGLLVGGGVGYGFGIIQDRAALRYKKQLENGQFKGGVGIVPGSFSRVAYLMGALLLVQLLCPVFFQEGMQWWVSGGVVTGYAFLLFKKFQKLRKVG